MSRGVARRIAVVLVVALVASSAIVAGAGVGAAQTDDDSFEGADEIYVNDDGDAVLVYTNSSDGTTTEYGIDVGSNVFYALVEAPVESETDTRADLSAVITPDRLRANGTLQVPRTGDLEAVEEFSADLEGETTDETNQFDADASVTINNSELEQDMQLARVVQSASVTGNLSTTPTRFETTTEFQATLLQSLGPDRSERFTLTETDGDYNIDASRDYVLSSFQADSYDTRSEARQTIQAQFSAAAQQFGGQATVTIQAYSFDSATNRLDIEYEVEYTGVEEGLAEQIAFQLSNNEDVDLTESEIDTITTKFQELNIDEASVRLDQEGTSISGSFTLELDNYDEWVRAGLTIGEATASESDAITQSDIDAVRDRLAAQEEANFQQRFDYSASLDQPDSQLTTVSSGLQYRTTNWGAYVDALGSRGVTGVDREFNLTARTEGDRITAEGFLEVSGRDVVGNAVKGGVNRSDVEMTRFARALRNAELEKAKLDVDLDESRVRFEAGATFNNLSEARDALVEAGEAPRFTSIVGRTEGDTVASYVHIENAVESGASEDDVRSLPYVDSETTVNMPGEWDRDFPSVDTQRAADFLGVSLDPGDGDDDDGGDGTTVSLQPTNSRVETGGTVTYDVVVSGIDGGVGSYDLEVNTSDASRARIVGATNEISASGGTDVAADGSGVSIGAFAGDTTDSGPVTVGTVTLEGVATGNVSLSVTTNSLSNEAGTQYTVASSAGADLSVVDEIVAPDVTGDGNPATDPDGDGLYEDVNGDGDTTPGDATVLFNAVFDRNAAVTDNPALFDFNGDNSVTPGDATVLFNEIFGA